MSGGELGGLPFRHLYHVWCIRIAARWQKRDWDTSALVKPLLHIEDAVGVLQQLNAADAVRHPKRARPERKAARKVVSFTRGTAPLT